MGRTKLRINTLLMDTLIDGTLEGLAMANIAPIPVGVSSVFSSAQELSCIVGLGGRTSGSISVDVSRQAACHIVGGLLGAEYDEITDDVLDGFMEVGNIITGFVKSRLEGSDFHSDSMTLPSIVFGGNIGIYHSRNITTCRVKFELPCLPAKYVMDRYFYCTMSLLRAAGS